MDTQLEAIYTDWYLFIMGGDNKQTVGGPKSYPLQAPKPVGKWIENIYKERLDQFRNGGQYESQNVIGMINEAVASGEPHVKLSVWDAPGQSRPKFEEATSHQFQPTGIGAWFGPAWSTHWFKVQLKIPKHMLKADLLELHWNAGNEGMVWTEDGNPIQGLSEQQREEWVIPDSFRDGEEHIIYIEMACNGMFGAAPGGDGIQPPDPNKYFLLSKADIVAVNPEARQLYIDHWLIGDAAREFPQESWEQHRALKVATDMMEAFEAGNKESILKARKIAREYLGDVNSHKVYDSGKEALVYGIGHCHIDTCWLWPWAETRRKTARSWSNQCDLMDRYPELHFAVSQAQQYKWLKEDYPYVFDRIKKKIKDGRFHPIGGSWVEHDTNMPSGESLVRQFLYGQRFFQGNFGERCKTFWLPDTFGYSSQLPQICRLAGMDRFLTQKLSWNNINKFPHTTFNWIALDGTQVICHMPPSETYTAGANFGDVKRSITQHKSMNQDETSLLVFGHGDGGGGPTWEHLEKLRRCRGISDKIGLLPRVHLGNTVDDFFDKLQEKADQFVTWYGELYFELHRGTYTTQANNKLNNRKSETVLRDLELLATIATIKDKNYKYPKKEIDDMWEWTLLCQFHDCLPGSSIEMCYDDSDELYAKLFETAYRVRKEIYKVLGLSETKAASVQDAVVLNTLPWHRKEIVDINEHEGGVACGSGNLLRVHTFKTSSDKKQVSVSKEEDGFFVLENDDLKIKVKDGAITSMYDRRVGREVIPKGGKANQFVIFDDKPLYWQAWDVEVYHLESRKELTSEATEIAEEKPHRVSVVTKTKISDKSSMKTTISLSAAIEGQQSHVEVHSEVEWHETMKFLKVEFPVDVRNTEASYETQFGVVKRPTHYNTTWDMAKFEVCCHRFADLSEHDYGVSILNDSKYGFATVGNLMRLSLLRAPKAPDAHADMGKHHIRWAILPHQGGLGHTTVRRAIEFNNKLTVLSKPADAATTVTLSSCPITVTGSKSLVLDTVKRGEDDEDVSVGLLPARKGRSVIVRIYDSLGGQARGAVQTSWDVKKVHKVNILEDDGDEVEFKDGKFEITLRPFEVASFRLEL